MRSRYGHVVMAFVASFGLVVAQGCTSGDKEEAAPEVGAEEVPAAEGDEATATTPTDGEKKKEDKKHSKKSGKKSGKKAAKKKKK